MRKYLVVIFILINFILNINSQDIPSELPEAPKGFHWQSLDEIKAYFLIPENWYFNSEKKDNTYAYFITKEDYIKEGFYTTGISINVVTNIKNIDSFNYIKAFIKELKKKVKLIKESELIEFGPYKQFNILYNSFSKELNKNIKIHEIFISNSKTNSMYFIMFETPEDEWDKNWEIAEKVLELFGIESEF